MNAGLLGVNAGFLAGQVPAPEDVTAGWVALLVFAGLAAVLVFLGFSLTKHLRRTRLNFDEADAAGDPEGNDGGPSSSDHRS